MPKLPVPPALTQEEFKAESLKVFQLLDAEIKGRIGFITITFSQTNTSLGTNIGEADDLPGAPPDIIVATILQQIIAGIIQTREEGRPSGVFYPSSFGVGKTGKPN